jgi:hypothetical protein
MNKTWFCNSKQMKHSSIVEWCFDIKMTEVSRSCQHGQVQEGTSMYNFHYKLLLEVHQLDPKDQADAPSCCCLLIVPQSTNLSSCVGKFLL